MDEPATGDWRGTNATVPLSSTYSCRAEFTAYVLNQRIDKGPN